MEKTTVKLIPVSAALADSEDEACFIQMSSITDMTAKLKKKGHVMGDPPQGVEDPKASKRGINKLVGA